MVITTMKPSDNDLSSLWQSACADYARETGISLTDERFPKVQGPQDLSRQLEFEKDNFEDFRMKRRPLFHAMQMVLAPFESWGDLIAGVAAAAFPPASSIMGAMLLLVRAARRVSDAFNVLVDLFHKLGNFALRLESYKGVPLSEGMKTVIVKVLVNFLAVCAASQKALSQGSLKARLSKWAKNILVEDTSISSLLDELEELTSQEHMMVSAHGLNLTHQALRNTEKLLDRDSHRNDRERLERIKAALNPVSASGQVLSSITQTRIPGSGSWVEDRLRSWWQGSQPLLWLHGGPGVGKSHLACKIITDLSSAESSATPAPAVASFFFKNNDVDLRSLNKALRTLAWQVAAQKSSFAVHTEEFCMKEDPENSYIVWEKLFLDYFEDPPSDVAACLVIDGIDEANMEEQEALFSLLEKVFSAEDDMNRAFSLRVVLLSRDSVRGMLDEHLLSWIPEIEVGNTQNKDDLHQYISQKLQRTKLFRGLPTFQEEIVRNISQGAEGMWEWANLVIKSVLRCRTKEQIRKVIKTMPRGISAMLREELQRLSRELCGLEHSSGDEPSDGEGTATQVEQLNILISFVTLAQKPLTLRRLDVILELILKEEVLSLEDDIRTVYSSLFSIGANNNGDGFDEDGDVVTLRHSSFYEFFMNSGESGPIHVNVAQAEAYFLYVCLCSLQNIRTPYSDQYIGLAGYAEDFLPSHLGRADPEKAGNLRGEISALFASLFSKGEGSPQFIEGVQVKSFDSYSFYPLSELSTLGSYWLDAQDADTANRRAEVVLNWLLPKAKQVFVNYAQSSAVASGACPFTTLFSLMVSAWSRHWLEPEEIQYDDGFPVIAPALLTVYNAMAAEIKETVADGPTTNVSDARAYYRDPSRVMLPAESQKLQRTPMWHARVAQALLLWQCDAQALVHFQISLDENQGAPTFNTQTLSVIHRDMARAYSELARHKEALEHFELSDSLRRTLKEDDDDYASHLIDNLLHKAQMKHHAKLTGDAIATAEEAWKLFQERNDQNFENFADSGTFPFFSIFLELNQTHRLRSVFEFVFNHSGEIADTGTKRLDFPQYLLDCFAFGHHTMYRVLHYALSHEDQHYLDIVVCTLEKVDTELDDPADIKYHLATILMDKGRKDVAVQGWHEVASLSKDFSNRWDEPCRMRSKCHLAALCLDDGDIPFCEKPLLILGADTELADVCLVIASWLRDRGDITNARDALRWCVKECIALLSDDDPSNDIDAFMRLFRAFLAATDSDEDLEAALYWVKQSNELQWMAYRTWSGFTKVYDDDGVLDVSGTLESVQVNSQSLEHGNDDVGDHVENLATWSVVCSPLTECLSCKREFGPIHHWYFCRSCPFSMLCRRCYSQYEADDPSNFSGSICDPGHKFYYTGSLLRPSERVPEGMVPLISSDGGKRTIWVEEWKDRLAVKWKTADFTFEGGLSAWCMRVLPEPQRTRWATVFQI